MHRRWPILVLGWVAFLTKPVCAEEAPVEKTPELRGVLAEGTNKRFGLFVPGSGQTGWATIGQTVGGWKLKEYRATDEVLVLAKGDREEILRLSENVVGTYHPGTVADAKALLEAVKFEQRVRQQDWLKDLPKVMFANHGLSNPSAEQLAEFKKAMERLFDHAKMQALTAAVMSEVYTQEELRAQAAFFASDAGQAALDQQAGGSQGPDEKEPPALKEFYTTPVGRSVKAKEALAQSQFQKTVTPWLNETMMAIDKAALKYVKEHEAGGPVIAP